MEGWTDFFVAEVGAAAALAGLLVVAISINISRIISFPTLPGRAANTLIVIGGALMIASLALLPHQPLSAYGWETLAAELVIAGTGLREVAHISRNRKPDDPLIWALAAAAAVVVSVVPPLIGGVLLVAGDANGLYWIAVGIILSFVVTLQNGWVLLIETLR